MRSGEENVEPVSLAAAYAALQELLLESEDVTAFLEKLAALSAAVVPASACGITMRGERDAYTVARSSRLASEVDEIQYGRGQGPCLEAMQTGERVVVDDLTTDSRWPQYGPHALERGIYSSVSLPLTMDGSVVGALNLYGTSPHQFDADAIRTAEAFSRQSSTALTLMARHAEQVTLQTQLRAAIASRAVIDQAIGIVMAQRHCSSAVAFAVLREASQHRNVKLSQVAAELVETVSGVPPVPARPFVQRN